MYDTSTLAPGFTCMAKRPSTSVMVPALPPTIFTDAPMTGSPLASFTTPLMVMLPYCCISTSGLFL